VLVFSDIQALLHYNAPFIPTVENAEAATGDFSTFSEATGAEAIDSTGVPFDVTWDTSVDTSTNIALQGNTSDIDLADGGKYLVMYNAWAHQGGAAGANRRSVNTYLTLAGNELAYGRGAGYARDSESFSETYSRGAAIIDATAGDDLQVHIQRDDTNTGADVETPSSVNSVSVLKLPDGADYLRARLAATSSDISGNTTFTDVVWDTSDEVDTDSFAFTPSSANISLKGDAGSHFIVTANVGLLNTAGGTTRQNYEMRLTLGGTEVPGTIVTSYVRGTNDTFYGQLTFVGMIAKTAGTDQDLNVEVRRESSAGVTTVIMGDRTAVSIIAVPTSAEVVRLSDGSGTQTTSNTSQALTFDSQDTISSAAFSHSTSTNSDRLEIDKAGDYLFFSTALTDTTSSGNNRQPFRMNWNLTGVTQSRGSYGAFNRANSTFTGGSSGAILFSSLGVSDYIGLAHLDETNNAPVDSTFRADGVALQGIALNNNFYGLDVLVSATGTHAVETDIPTTDLYAGGGFVIQELSGTGRNVTSLRVTESGTVDAQDGLSNVELWYDLDESAPFDCTGEAFGDGEAEIQFGSASEFNAADGSVSFTGSVPITTTKAMCAYVLYDVVASSSDSQTVQLSIDDPALDVGVSLSPSIGPSNAVAPTGLTTIRNAELTQIHYHWRNDDGNETNTGATSVDGSEDTAAIGFSNGTTRRLRLQVSAEGSTSSPATQYRLEYAQKVTTCPAVASWTDVGTGGAGDWDIVNTANLTDGNDTTLVTNAANGALTAENTTRLTPNGGQKDTSSQTGNITLTDTQYVELEYAIEPTVSAPQGNTYCFRVSDAGTSLRNYDVYAEGTISADIDVSASSTQVSSLDLGSTGQYIGGTFVVERSGTNRTLTDITIAETGTVDAQSNLANPTLYYELDTTTPFDCTDESYSGAELSIAGSAFTSVNGTSTFTGINQVLNTSASFCGYIVVDVGSGASNGDSINIQITDPSVDVLVTSSSVGPSTAVSPTGSTSVTGPIRTQTHYHWRSDNGSEVTASSASSGVEDTPILSVPKDSNRRLRLQVSNEGGVDTTATTYRLEYGTKVTTCIDISSWTDVDAVGGAFDMVLSSQIVDGNTSDIDIFGNGAMTEENTTFVGVGALRETTSESSAITLTSTQYTELEYSIAATDDAGDDTSYCFRVTDAGSELETYTTYGELTTREKQDFFIQRGVEQITGLTQTLTAGVDYVAPSATSSAFVRISNSQHTGAGNNTGGNNTNSDDYSAYISDQSDITSSFTISRPANAISDTRVYWEIVEFIGIPGTDNEMHVRDVGEIDLATSILIATGTAVSGVVDDSDIVVFVTGQYNNDAGRTDHNDGLFTAHWNGTTSQPVLTRAEGDSSVGVSYAVVEFTGVNWSVQRIEHTYASATSTETETLIPIPAVTQAFVHVQKRVTGDNGLDEAGHRVWVSSAGAVSFQLESGASTPTQHVAVAWVVANTQSGTGALKTYQSFGTIASGGPEPNSNIIGIGGTVNIANASIFATNDSSGTGTAYPRGINGYTILSGTTYELWQSDTGQNNDYRVDVVEWPVAEISIRQNYYRFYADNDAIDPTDPWPIGVNDLGENTSITGADDPLGQGEQVRVRMSLLINNATLPAEVNSYKLQYGRRDTTCSAVSVWTDVGGIGSGSIWRGFDGTPVDGVELATSTPALGTLNLSVSDVAGTYEEENSSAVNPYAADLGEDIEYDWHIEHNGATQLSDYCFRMVESDGTELTGYDNYPTLRTTGYTPIVDIWRWYDDAENETPTTTLAAEQVTPTNIVNGNEIKLRVNTAEVEGAPGTNVKFKLQYSEYVDFSDGGTDLTPTADCLENSLWCYADGGGTDNATITTSVISNTDACVAGVGNGCGTHNEFATTTSLINQAALSTQEYEFALQHAGARANAVYYFRLYDVTNDVTVGASSSYPSVQTEGASLIFSLNGINSGTLTEGITTDATSTPTGVAFGSLPFGSEYEAAHTLSIDTNATEGYQMLMVVDQDLTNPYGTTIAPVTGTNPAPVGWGTGCAISATGCVGYHAGDDSLEGGSVRFGADDSYAAFSTTPQEIMYSSIPTNESHDIVYKIKVESEQEAGEYQKTITYIAIPVF